MKPRLLANENFRAPSVQHLREWGHDSARRGAVRWHRSRQGLRLRPGARAADLSRRATTDSGWLTARVGVMGSIPVEQMPVFMAVPMGASLDAKGPA